MKKWIHIAVVGLIVALPILADAPVFADDPIAAPRRLPSNVQAFLRIPNIESLKTRWSESAIGKLQRDESFEDIRAQIMERFEVVSEKMEDQLGIPLEELLSVPAGEIMFAVFPNRDKKIGVVAMLDFGEQRDTVDSLIEKVESMMEDAGFDRSTDEIENTRVVVHELEAGNKLAYCIRDSCLLVGNGVGALENVLLRWDGDSDRTFADNEVYTYIAERCKSSHDEPLMEYFIDPVGLITASFSASGEANFQAQMILGFLPSLGLNKLRAVGGAIDMSTEDFDSVNRALIYIDAPATGVLNVFRFPALPQEPPEWVPSSATSYVGMNWDLAEAYAAIESLVDMFQGAGALKKIVEDLANEPNGPKFHLKHDLFDLLNGRIHLFTDLSDPEDPASARVCLALGLKDSEDNMEGVLRKFSETPGFPGSIREFRGINIYELDTTGQLGAKLGATSARGHLFVSSNVTLIDQIIRGDVAPLKDDRSWLEVRKFIPDDVSIVGFQKQDPQARMGYDLLRSSGNAEDLFEGPFADLFADLDLSTLPPFQSLEKYMVPTTSYAIPDERGVFLIQFGLRSK